MDKGVLYVAVKDKLYVEFCHISIHSLRQSGYTGPICVITDMPEAKIRDDVGYKIIPQTPYDPIWSSRNIKTQLHKYTPFETTLFLDCDTLVLNDISSIWKYADSNTLCMSKDYHPTIENLKPIDVRQNERELNYTRENFPTNSTYWCSSTMLWKKSTSTTNFFNFWFREWLRFRHVDQLSLVRAINRYNLKVNELPLIYDMHTPLYEDYEQAQKDGVVIYATWGNKKYHRLLNYLRKQL